MDLRRYNSGSAQASLNRNFIYPVAIRVPSLTEQQAIACILGSLDDKIELNRRMNRTLEEQARAIFQSWFVDFDPVRAKAAGQPPPGLNPELAALFPAAFENSELGEIPQGWSVAAIKDHASRIQYGLTESASDNPVGPRFLRITDIRGGKVDWRAVPYCQVSDSDLEKYRVHDGDVFVARTGASTGENVYVVEPPIAVFASYLVRFQFEERGIARVVGEFMRSEMYFSFVKGSIGGSAQPNASAQTLASAQMVFPSASIATRFYELIQPLDEKRAANAKQSESLASLRDALLPKLISGELRVTDAERIAGRCA
jgi:type I restriction enzyme S subunit